MKRDQLCVVWVTAGSAAEGRKIARALLRARLAACVNIVPRLESHYWWKGKVEQAGEVLLVIKTARRHFPELARRVKKAHSYTTPEIIALPVVAVEAAYARWWRESML